MKKIIEKIILVILMILIVLLLSVLYQKLILKKEVPKLFGFRYLNSKNWKYGTRDWNWRDYNN